MYVAVTRAQERLFLLAPSKATSVFVKELDKSLVHEIDRENPVTEDGV
jgi:superfamily I DNA/RNA helicase